MSCLIRPILFGLRKYETPRLLAKSSTRRMSSDASTSSQSINLQNGFFGNPKDYGSQIRIISSTLAILSALGIAFDTVYRRVSREQLVDVRTELEDRIDKVKTDIAKLDMKIDGLSGKIDSIVFALLNVAQRNELAVAAENRTLRDELERCKKS